MSRPSFLARTTLGQPNSVLIAMAMAFVLALAPHGIRKALEHSSTQFDTWLPSASVEGRDLAWFRSHFPDGPFALMSWEGCTLGASEAIEKLAQKFLPTEADVLNAASDPALEADYRLRRAWFSRVVTGPRAIREFAETHYEAEAAARFEGALVGPTKKDSFGNSLGNETRPTCVVVYLSPEAVRNGRASHRAVEKLSQIAVEECGIARDSIRLGGPAITNAALDAAWMQGLSRIGFGVVLVSALLSRWRLRSWKATLITLGVGLACASASLALVYYTGVVQVVLLQMDRLAMSRVDALSAFLPFAAFALGAFGAIHSINYYCQVRREEGVDGAVEKSVRRGWGATVAWAIATGFVFLSLGTSEIAPLRSFGLFGLLSTLATLGVLSTLLPILLHQFGVTGDAASANLAAGATTSSPSRGEKIFRFSMHARGTALAVFFGGLCWLGWGVMRLGGAMPASQWFGVGSRIEEDSRWFEKNVGNVVPVDVVIAWPQTRCRAADQVADADGLHYRMTMLERLEMIREIQRRQAAIPEVSQVLSVASFSPKSSQLGLGAVDASADYAKNLNLEQQRERWMAGDYYQIEAPSGEGQPGGELGRELWRISARVALFSPEDQGVDYGSLMSSLEASVENVLRAYDQRDQVVRKLHAMGKKLHGARCVFLYRSNVREGSLTPESAELTLLDLVRRSGAAQQDTGVIPFNLANFDKPLQGSTVADDQYRQAAVKALEQYDAIIVAALVNDPAVQQLAAKGLPIVDVSTADLSGENAATGAGETWGAPNASQQVGVAYVGAPVWCRWLQRQTPLALGRCLAWATLGVALAMMALLRSVSGGIIATSAILLPIVAVLGVWGWFGADVNVGFLLAVSLTLCISCGNAVHFLGWHRRALGLGLVPQAAATHAFERSGNAMAQSTWFVGATLAVIAFGPLAHWQSTGLLSLCLLCAGLITQWVILPSLVVSPLGFYFAMALPRTQSGRHTQPDVVKDSPEWLRPHIGMPPSVGVPVQWSVGAELAQRNTAPLDERRARAESPLVSAEERQALADGPHAELHAKLRRLRRESTRDA